VKTRDAASGMKVFLNIVANEHVEAPHMKSFEELEGEEGCRVPLSVGTPVEDFDKKGEPCVTYDLVANPAVVEECQQTPAFRDTVVQLCLGAVAQKYKVELDARYKLPKLKYKGTTVQIQRLRIKKQSQIQELPSNAPVPGASKASRAAAAEAKEGKGGLPQPDFCIFYARPGAPAIDGFAAQWGPPPDDAAEAADAQHLCGLDLPCYRTNEFQERIRGTMKSRAERQAQAEAGQEGQPEPAAAGENETREMLAGRTCFVQVRMPDLDPHVPALKQLRAEVSDECLRLLFPLLPRSGRAAYGHLTLWWPRLFCSAQANAEWDPKVDTLTVSLPTEAPAEAGAFDQALLDAVF